MAIERCEKDVFLSGAARQRGVQFDENRIAERGGPRRLGGSVHTHTPCGSHGGEANLVQAIGGCGPMACGFVRDTWDD